MILGYIGFMNIFRFLLLSACFAAGSVFWGLIAVAEIEIPPLPVPNPERKELPVFGKVYPPSLSELERATPHRTNKFFYRYGYTMPILNTMRKGFPAVRNEPMAYVNACYQDNPHSQIVIRQYSYAAQTQSGIRQRLACKSMPLAKKLLEAINNHFFYCSNKAGKELGWEELQEVEIHSWMIYQHKGRPTTEQRAGRLSLHSAARAIDFNQLKLHYATQTRLINVFDAVKKDDKGGLEASKKSPKEQASKVAGSTESVASEPVTSDEEAEKNKHVETRKYLESLRACWDDAVIERYGCRRWRSYKYRASVGWENVNHQKHIHLALPYCPTDPNFYGI